MKFSMLKYFCLITVIFSSGFYSSGQPLADCSYTFEQAVEGIGLTKAQKKTLVLADVEYYSYDGRLHKGQLVVQRELKNEIISIFRELMEAGFQVYKAVPVVYYHWNDSLSMVNNNTSCFNMRKIKGTYMMSRHSEGRAIDINPVQNPQIKRGRVAPGNAVYRKDMPGTVYAGSAAVRIFRKYGWRWGGEWRSSKDYQHFEK